MKNSPREQWKNIQGFWTYINRLLREQRQQPELAQSVITEEWWNDVHLDSKAFSFTLTPPLQSIYWAIHEFEKRRRVVSFIETTKNGKEGQETWECDVRLRILNQFFDTLLEREFNNLPTTISKTEITTMPRHLCEKWTMKFLKVE